VIYQWYYSIRSKLIIAQTDVSSTEIHLDTSISVTTNMDRREQNMSRTWSFWSQALHADKTLINVCCQKKSEFFLLFLWILMFTGVHVNSGSEHHCRTCLLFLSLVVGTLVVWTWLFGNPIHLLGAYALHTRNVSCKCQKIIIEKH
jgi:hypothetical protein